MTKWIDGKLHHKNDFRYEVIITMPGRESFRKKFEKRKDAQKFIRLNVEMRVGPEYLRLSF